MQYSYRVYMESQLVANMTITSGHITNWSVQDEYGSICYC